MQLSVQEALDANCSAGCNFGWREPLTCICEATGGYNQSTRLSDSIRGRSHPLFDGMTFMRRAVELHPDGKQYPDLRDE